VVSVLLFIEKKMKMTPLVTFSNTFCQNCNFSSRIGFLGAVHRKWFNLNVGVLGLWVFVNNKK